MFAMAFCGSCPKLADMAETNAQQVARPWREQYEKGRTALDRNNLDYAIQLFTQVLEKEPAFFECRQALRAAQFKRSGGGAGFFKKFLGSANPWLVKAQATLRNNPLDALNAAEQALNSDPTNLTAHRILAEAALVAEFPRTAVLSMEIVFKQNPRDKELAMKLARTLSETGQAERAEAIMDELARALPNDPEVAQAVKDVAANRTLNEGGYDTIATGQGSYRDILRDEKTAVSLEQAQREVKTSDVTDHLIEEYENRLAGEPGNLRLLRSIAELYAQQKRFDRALEYYQRLAGTEAADPSLERAIAETKVKRIEYAIDQLNPGAPDHEQQAAALQAEREAFLLEDCRARVERYPSDLVLRFELGQLYFAAGRITEAIQEFQKAQNNPHKRIAAMLHLGLCFGRRGMHDLAARTLQNALKEKVGFDDEKKELLYALGMAYEKMGKREEGIEQLKQIYEVDIGYRDVAAKVDAYYDSQGKG